MLTRQRGPVESKGRGWWGNHQHMQGLSTAPSSVGSRDAHQQTGTSRVVGTNGVRLSALLLLYCGGTLGAAGGPTCSSVPAEVHRQQRAEGGEGLQTPPGGRRGLTGLLTVKQGATNPPTSRDSRLY